MHFELLKGLVMFTFFQAVIFSGVTYSLTYKYPKRRITINILFVFFTLIALRAAIFFANNFIDGFTLDYYASLILDIPIFIQPVLIYLFIRLSLTENDSLRHKDIFHFLPAFLFFAAILFGYVLGANKSDVLLSGTVINSIEAVQLVGYAIASYRLAVQQNRGHSKNLWSKAIAVCMFLAGLLIFYGTFKSSSHSHHAYNPFIFVHMLNGILIFLLSFLLLSGFLNWKNFFKSDDKYAQSGLSQSKARQLQNRILQLMERDQIFLNPDLSLNDLGQILETSRFNISQVLSERLNKSFYDLINEFRVKEAQNRLLSEQHLDESISEIAYSSGFNSIATFNRSFKTITGETPSEFRKSAHSI